MRKNIIPLLILGIMICVSSCLVIGFAMGIFEDDDETSYVYHSDTDINDTYTQYDISKGTIEVKREIEGYVSYADSAVEYMDYKVGKDCEVYVKLFDYINEDDVVGKSWSSDIKSKSEGTVVKIELSEELLHIELLSNNKSYIIMQLDEEYQNKIDASTKIEGTFGGETQELNIYCVEPVVEDGMYNVYLENPFLLYENTKVDILIYLDVKENVVLIPKQFIQEDSSENTYIEILTSDGDIEKKKVNLGESNDTYWEIVDGDDLEGQIAVIDKEKLLLEE